MKTLYDIDGKPIRENDLTREIASASMTGVRHVWNESVASGLTPQRLAALLTGAGNGDHDDFLTLAEEMEERDLHYACEIGKRKLAVSKLPVVIESASDSKNDIELADSVRSLFKRIGFRFMLKDLLDALGKGFSVVEILWDRTGQIWRPKAYEHRDPHWFCWDRVSLRKLRLRDEKNLYDGIELPPYKFIIHTPRIKSGLPIRGGFARLAAWAYMCKGYTLKDWLAFSEVYGMPLRMGKYGPGASKDDIDVLKMAVANLGTDAAAVFPQGMEIEMKDISMQASTDLYERLAQYLDNQVTKGILGQTATTQGTPGKLGNESAQDEVRKDIRDDDAGQLEATLQRDLVNPFIDLNYGPQQSYPVLRLYAPRKKNVAAITDALSRLVPLGLRVEVSAVRDMLGLPDPPQGAEVLGQRPGPAPMPAASDEESAQAINEMLSDWQLSDEADFTRRENATDIDVLPPKELKLEPKNTH